MALITKFVVLIFVVEVTSVNKFLRGQSILYGLSSMTENIVTNSTCSDQLYTLYRDVDLRRFWALKVMDASGQPETGFIYGNNLWIGSHFQCMDASNTRDFEVNYEKVPHPERTPYDFPPYALKFAMVYMIHNNTHQFHMQMPLEHMIELGLCVPVACDTKELKFFLQSYLDQRYLKIAEMYDMNIEIQEVKFLGGDTWFSSPKTTVTLTIIMISIVLVIIGTIYDVNVAQPNLRAAILQKESSKNLTANTGISMLSSNDVKHTAKNEKLELHEPGTVGRIIQCFSIYSNTRALIKTKLPANSIEMIHGMRVYSLTWVICVHTVYYQIDYLKNVAVGFRLSEQFVVQVLGNSTYCVDTFLFLSGFLLSYTFYKSKNGKIKCKRPINVWNKILEVLTMFTHRYLRLTPVYFITILISDMLFAKYRETTSLYSTEQPDINCPKYWWRNLLYINNFYPRSEMCLSWSWYLSADTQFFLIASILLILSTIVFMTSVSILLLLILTCMGITAYRSYSIGYIPTMDEQFQQLDAIYDLPWNRIGPYLVGVIVGYVLVVKLKGQLNLKKLHLAILWIIFPMINLWIVFAIYKREISVEFSAVYMGVSRTLWGVGLGWLFVACFTGNGGIVNQFLSFRGWIPLSRLTYCGYLINPLLIHIVYMGSESSQSSSIAGFSLAIFGYTLLTFVMAYFYSVLFESPYILLTKMLFNKLTKSKRDFKNPA